MTEQKLKGKVIVVSGGTKGVGRASSEEFARQGAKVVIGGRDEESALKSIRLMKTYGSDGLFVHTDLLKVADCKNLFQKAYERFGKIDGFFNYAGVTPVSPLDTCDEKIFDWVMDVNFKACFFCCQEAIKYMRMNGSGAIVLTGSAHAWGGQKDRAAYSVSKGAVLTLTEHIAHHYAEDQIRANFVTMGWTPTEGELALRASQGMTPEETRAWAASFIPYGRMTEVEDQVPGILYLLSDYSQMTTGANLRMTGGLYF